MNLLKKCLAVVAFPLLIGAGCGSSTPAPTNAGASTESETATSAANSSVSSDAEEQPDSSAATDRSSSVPLPVDLMAMEMAAYERAKPIFEEQCAACHTPDPSRKKPKKGVSHFSMAGYPFDGHHKTELGQSIRAAIGGTDKPATMPQDDPGSIEGADLDALLAWSDAFDAAASAKVGYHASAGAHEHSSEPGQKEEHKHPKKEHKHAKKADESKKEHDHKKKAHDHEKKTHDHKKAKHDH
tara:strand:+ start:45369 stop:46091 length:723 start_codon:yes stop_codon:yes gene_type:complete